MNIEILFDYMEQCKEYGSTPTFKYLNLHYHYVKDLSLFKLKPNKHNKHIDLFDTNKRGYFYENN